MKSPLQVIHKTPSIHQLAQRQLFYKDYLVIPDRMGAECILLKSIYRLEADSNYTKIYTDDDNCYTASKSLGYFDKQLAGTFLCRIHNSHIINTELIKRINRTASQLSVVLKNGDEVPVSRSRKEEILTLLLPS